LEAPQLRQLILHRRKPDHSPHSGLLFDITDIALT